jgi:hypothetical protein
VVEKDRGNWNVLTPIDMMGDKYLKTCCFGGSAVFEVYGVFSVRYKLEELGAGSGVFQHCFMLQ